MHRPLRWFGNPPRERRCRARIALSSLDRTTDVEGVRVRCEGRRGHFDTHRWREYRWTRRDGPI